MDFRETLFKPLLVAGDWLRGRNSSPPWFGAALNALAIGLVLALLKKIGVL